MFKIFDLWMNDERFFDADKQKPKELEIEGEGATFSQLVKSASQSRGLTAQLVLKRLEKVNVISVNRSSDTVKLTKEDNVFISKDELGALEVGFTAIANLAATVNHNIQNLDSNDEKFFQRGCWNYQFSPMEIDQTRKTIRRHLEKTDRKSRDVLTTLAEPERREGQLTAGIGVFYFEE
jgi:hypothetical protein